MIQSRSIGIGQFAKAVTQACGGQRITSSFPSLKRDWETRAVTLPELVPAFAMNMPLHKINLKPTFNLNVHLFRNKSQAICGVGGKNFIVMKIGYLSEFFFCNYEFSEPSI